MRTYVVCSLTLSPSCPYNFGAGVQEGSFVVISNSLLSFLPLIRWNHTGSSRSAGAEEALVLCVQNNHQSENLNRFTRKKSEDVLCCSVCRIKMSLLNLGGSRLSILQDCIYSLSIFISCVFITFYDCDKHTIHRHSEIATN